MSRLMSTQRSFRATHLAAAALALAASLSGVAVQAAPSLGFSSNAQVWGSLSTSYTSPILGTISFSLNGPQDYQSYYTNSGNQPNPLATASYTVPAGQAGADPVYDIVTSQGSYGFSYDGTAQVEGLKLRTKVTTSVVDSNGALQPYTPNTSLYAYSYAQWSTGFYFAPTASHAAGTYGAILVKIQLDGHFPVLSDPSVDNNGWASLNVGSSFTDTAGVQYSSSFSLYANAGDPSWNGVQVAYKKLLFQYGTAFNINAYQYAQASNSGSSDFFNTGKITEIEIPFGATLETGAGQAGLGTNTQLFGSVFNSATADAQNTNWDFGNNGGGFTPNVPEPQTWLLMLAGLGAVASLARRRGAR